jgi:putative oxygen-independent coproporphyrinogen III oxidase
MKSIKHIYIHIPFCAKKCIYCDFPIQAIGNSPSNRGHFQVMQDEYIDKLLQEIDFTFRSSIYKLDELKSLYIGGGTPSLLSPINFERLLTKIYGSYKMIGRQFEFSIENEPDSLNDDLLQSYKRFGVNRLTLGVQTLNDKCLKFMNRNHDSGDVLKAVSLISKYFNLGDLGFDVLLGLPNEERASLPSTIEKLISLKPGHLSCYILTVEKFTKLSDLVQKGKILIREDTMTDQYLLMQDLLTGNGFTQYEISNSFNQNNGGQRSLHNMMYWTGDTDFFGFGMGAASLLNSQRLTRPTSLKRYYKFVEELKSGSISMSSVGENEALNLVEKLKVVFMGNLRTTDGLALASLRNYFVEYSQVSSYELFITSLQKLSNLITGKLSIDTERIKVPIENFIVLNSILKEIFVIIEQCCQE